MTADVDGANRGSHVKVKIDSLSTFLANEKLLECFLDRMITEIHARPLARAQVFNVPLAIRSAGGDPFADEGGITGIQVLSTSHVAFHSWPAITDDGKLDVGETGKAVIDVYSCRPFESQTVAMVVREFYQPSAMHLYRIPVDEADPRWINVDEQMKKLLV